jgi:hypothetical protein
MWIVKFTARKRRVSEGTAIKNNSAALLSRYNTHKARVIKKLSEFNGLRDWLLDAANGIALLILILTLQLMWHGKRSWRNASNSMLKRLNGMKNLIG